MGNLDTERDEGKESPAWCALDRFLKGLHHGPWSFVQLRGESLCSSAIDDDDVDLLGSRESVDALVEACYAWTREGHGHFRIQARRAHKTELTLYSVDGRHRVLFDLWIELPQLGEEKRVLTYPDCLEILDPHAGAIQRLPLEAEACVYIQHLAAKGKDLTSSRVQSRLAHYCQALREENKDCLHQHLESIRKMKRMSSEAIRYSYDRLRELLGRRSEDFPRWKRPSVGQRMREGMVAAPRRLCLLSIMGCDGAGKSTLADRIVDGSSRVRRVFTGKHLYRKSILYKLAVIFIRPLTFQSRERFDELLAPLVYLRASLGLIVKWVRWRKEVTLIDRSLVDFLYLDRKTDAPRFARSQWLTHFFGHRIPTIHCVVRFDRIRERKDEMTASGHKAYDNAMFQHHANRRPTDYLCFNNDLSLEEAHPALARIIDGLE